MVKLINKKDDSIPVFQMKDGEIAIITEWGENKQYIGRIVQRYGVDLATLGAPLKDSWPTLFKQKSSENRLRVVVLQKGAELSLV